MNGIMISMKDTKVLNIVFLLLMLLNKFMETLGADKKNNMYRCAGENLGIKAEYVKASYKTLSKIDCALYCQTNDKDCENFHFLAKKRGEINCFIGSAIGKSRGYGTCNGLVSVNGATTFYAKVECVSGQYNTTTGDCDCEKGYGGAGCTTRLNDCSDTTGKLFHMEWVLPPAAKVPFQVSCFNQITFIMVRSWAGQKKVSFKRNFEEYAAGFGTFEDDYYLGNRKIHMLTSWTRDQHISLKLYRFTLDPMERHYYNFRVRNESELFRTTITKIASKQVNDAWKDAFLSPGQPSLSMNEMSFSTYDKDNDNSTRDCASLYGGGWWYNDCTAAPLTAAELMNATQIASAGGPDQPGHVDWATQPLDQRKIGISSVIIGLFTY